MELLTEHGADGTNVAELGIGTNEERDPHRQHPRGREDPRHRPRRLRRLGGDRRHGPGAGPPRLRGAASRPSRSTAARSSAPESWSSERWRRPLLAVPNVSEGRDAARIGALERAFSTGVRCSIATPTPTTTGLSSPSPARRRALTRRRWPEARREADRAIDMTAYEGVHPAIGALDVCPLVWLDPEDREPARADGGRGRRRRSAAWACRSSSTASWPAAPERRRARLLPQRRPGRALAADGGAASCVRTSGPSCRTAPPARPWSPPARRSPPSTSSSTAATSSSRAPSPPACASPAAACRACGRSACCWSSGRAQVSTNVHDPAATPLGDGRRAGPRARGAARRPAGRGRAGRVDSGRRARRLPGRRADPRLRPGAAGRSSGGSRALPERPARVFV